MKDSAVPRRPNDVPADASMDIELNGEPHALPTGSNVQQLVALLGLGEQAVAIAVNREIVPRQGWGKRTLLPQDRVDVVRPIGGG